ncbi:MAG: GNAT family N-acetyltransferase [Chlorobi bacterium]|nr:GNAT family N-acetyltransferase [Chlorobiota bacterium]
MHWTLKSWDELTTEELYDILRLRGEVFVVGQSCTCTDPDGKDPFAYHLMMRTPEGEPAGYARLFPPGKYQKGASSFGRVAVRKPWRGQGWGKELTRRAVSFLKERWPDRPVVISAQQYLEDFYKEAGFRPSGEPYLEENMWHIRMVHD